MEYHNFDYPGSRDNFNNFMRMNIQNSAPSPRIYHHRLDGAALSTIISSSSDDTVLGGKKIRTEEMRQKHNLISQKGRQKINDEIAKLKQLLPECRNVECNKAAILQCAVKNLERYTKCTSTLCINIQNLEKDNQRLWRIIQQMAIDFSRTTGRSYHDILAVYNIEPPLNTTTEPLIKEDPKDGEFIHPHQKKQANIDDGSMSDYWNLHSY